MIAEHLNRLVLGRPNQDQVCFSQCCGQAVQPLGASTFLFVKNKVIMMWVPWLVRLLWGCTGGVSREPGQAERGPLVSGSKALPSLPSLERVPCPQPWVFPFRALQPPATASLCLRPFSAAIKVTLPPGKAGQEQPSPRVSNATLSQLSGHQASTPRRGWGTLCWQQPSLPLPSLPL